MKPLSLSQLVSLPARKSSSNSRKGLFSKSQQMSISRNCTWRSFEKIEEVLTVGHLTVTQLTSCAIDGSEVVNLPGSDKAFYFGEIQRRVRKNLHPTQHFFFVHSKEWTFLKIETTAKKVCKNCVQELNFALLYSGGTLITFTCIGYRWSQDQCTVSACHSTLQSPLSLHVLLFAVVTFSWKISPVGP